MCFLTAKVTTVQTQVHKKKNVISYGQMILVSSIKIFTVVIRKHKGACDNAVLKLVKPMLVTSVV
jgi:hypothetical protein